MNESFRGVRPGSGENTIVTGHARAHAQEMKKPGTVGCKEPWLKIKMKEGMRFRPLVAAKKLQKFFTTKVMDNTGREENLAGMVGRKGVTVKEAAREMFNGGKTNGFVDQG